jgi:hypothetical protein
MTHWMNFAFFYGLKMLISQQPHFLFMQFAFFNIDKIRIFSYRFTTLKFGGFEAKLKSTLKRLFCRL